MASNALLALFTGLVEVQDLQRANPTPRGGISMRPRVTRAINRASVVMLSSHLEKYLHAVNEEATMLLNSVPISATRLPDIMKLQHSQQPITQLSATQWDNRAAHLTAFASGDGWLWSNGTGQLAHERLIMWMKTPKTRRIARLFRLWGIADIFAEITRSQLTRQRLVLKLDELVEKRNNIAHGDIHVDATPTDLTEYRQRVSEFCSRADRRLARVLVRQFGVGCGWY